MKQLMSSIFVAVSLVAPVGAQEPGDSERLVIPLSDPGRPAELEVAMLQGSIAVLPGEAGRVVVVAVESGERRRAAGRRRSESEERRYDQQGLHRVPNGPSSVRVEEKNNRVEVGVDSWRGGTDLRIEVPPASSVEISTVTAGDLSVNGLSGELVLHNTNGGIDVRDVTGPVDATTVNGDVKVVFGPTMASAPMAFSTLNGDVDLTLPATARVDVSLRADNGGVFTDFEIALRRSPPTVDENEEEGRYRVSIAREVTGTIGGGGPELYLKSFNGDILLRRAGG